MKYCLLEMQAQGDEQKTAGVKARDDVDAILLANGYKGIKYVDKLLESDSAVKAVVNHKKKAGILKKLLSGLKPGDELVVQFPIFNNSIFHSKTFKKLRKNGVKISLIIHDLESLRDVKSNTKPFRKRVRYYIEEKSIVKTADRIIVHNDKMKKHMEELGYASDRMVSLEIFDYLIPEYEEKKNIISEHRKSDGPVIIAGSLRRYKVGYVYELPEATEFNLYGVDFEDEGKQNLHYFGSFMPNDLPFAVNGSFGLVWDGASSQTCSGVYGEYLKINNPHKTSFYIAAGFPVIIWSEAALADFVTENGLGITVSSLYEIKEKLEALTDEEYEKMVENVQNMGDKLRSGAFLMKALS